MASNLIPFPGVPVLQDVSAEVDAKANRLVREEKVAYEETRGRSVVCTVLGDSWALHWVTLRFRGTELIGTCSCPHVGLCSHILAAAIVVYEEHLRPLLGEGS